jgi:hypothetical protein
MVWDSEGMKIKNFMSKYVKILKKIISFFYKVLTSKTGIVIAAMLSASSISGFVIGTCISGILLTFGLLSFRLYLRVVCGVSMVSLPVIIFMKNRIFRK